MLDSIDNVRKNQRMPNEIILFLLNIIMASVVNEISNRKHTIVRNSKKLFEIGKS